MASNRNWMMHRSDGEFLSERFIEGVEEFIKFAMSRTRVGDMIKCPCSICNNRRFLKGDDVKFHIYKNGFTRGYTQWNAHGEPFNVNGPNLAESSTTRATTNYSHEAMVIDAMGPEMYNDYISPNVCENEEQALSQHAANFFRLLQEADKPVWSGCSKHTNLSTIAQLMSLKSEFNMLIACYDRMLSIVKGIMPEGDQLEDTFYKTKKILSSFDLGVVKIHACVNDFMLYYRETESMTHCRTCFSPRYKEKVSRSGHRVPQKVLRYLPLTSRLQRLYMSRHIAEHMLWHSKNQLTDKEMSHPVHSEAWKHFDRSYPQFSLQPHSVRLGLCTDGFNPFGMSNVQYSCWPVIIVVYNLPPWMCMQQENLFLSMVIPGPKSPGKNLDIYLRPLIDELKILWYEGIETYDMHTKKNFQLKAALMWTISDFPGYGMLSGWSTHGLKSCPYCMGQTKSFRLKNGGKTSFFDCHRQFLPPEHPFRKQRDKFYKDRVEKDIAQQRRTGGELRSIVENLPHVESGRANKRQQIYDFGCIHNWVKKSIFWELPYWDKNLIRHNLDVMHIEKNVFDNIFNTIMDIKGKTKDNFKARKDLELYCNRPELHIYEDDREKLFVPNCLLLKFILGKA